MVLLGEALALAVALSLDGFVASFAYGSNHIRMPWQSVLVVDGVCCGAIGLFLWLGSLGRPFLPVGQTDALYCGILLVLGGAKLLDGIIKSAIKRHGSLQKSMGFSVSSLRFVLYVYAQPVAADVDGSKTISPVEALSLALALSADGMAVGFGAALGQASAPMVVACSLVVNAAALVAGCWLGNRAAQHLRFNVSWLSGVVLIVLALMRLVSL